MYNINIILFMDLTSLLMLLLSQHLISQFSSNRTFGNVLILIFNLSLQHRHSTKFIFFRSYSPSCLFILKIRVQSNLTESFFIISIVIIFNQSLNCDYQKYIFLLFIFLLLDHHVCDCSSAIISSSNLINLLYFCMHVCLLFFQLQIFFKF